MRISSNQPDPLCSILKITEWEQALVKVSIDWIRQDLNHYRCGKKKWKTHGVKFFLLSIDNNHDSLKVKMSENLSLPQDI